MVTCAHCGTPLPADARFCSSCGRGAAETAQADQVAASYQETAHGESVWPGAPADGEP